MKKTIEEKAKRYDEALEKARQLCAYPTTKPFISDLQDLFPELKESENEKIRKALVKYFQEGSSSSLSVDLSSAIAWLEKQGGEQKPVDIRFPHYNNIVDKVFGQGNLESWERAEAEAIVALAKEELFKDMQKQWKPSDEQILAINTAINVIGKGTINGRYLMELLEQLKAL